MKVLDLNTQIRMVGEELIRRADQFDFGNLDLVQKLTIQVEINGDPKISIPDIKFELDCGNKVIYDAYTASIFD